MMALAATVILLGLLFLNLIALAVAGKRVFGSYLLSRAVTPPAAALVAFFCEHFVGGGRLTWVWPVAAAASVWLIVRERGMLRREWRVEAIFAAAFAWAFAWRFAFPDVTSASEQLSDLAMISSYMPGARLPPEDVWFPPFAFDIYYSFQFYAAALLGRVYGLLPGLALNVAVALTIALTILAAAGAARTILGRSRGATLVVAAFALGGTGASLPLAIWLRNPPLDRSMRLIGGLIQYPVELPSETFAYLTALGDFHPPLSGFYLLTLALLAIALIESGIEARASHAVLPATVVVAGIANGWTLPLQAALVSAWIAYRLVSRRPVDWAMLALGTASAAVLCYPFLSGFAVRSADYHVSLKFVPSEAHTPFLPGLLVLYPIIAAAVIVVAFDRSVTWAVWAAALWVLLLVVSEVFFIDDAYSGRFERFNTTLKWWPWIQAGALLSLGAYGLRSRSRAVRFGVGALLTVVALYGVDLVRVLALSPKEHAGKLDGSAWITSDAVEQAIVEFLKTQPRSIVLQRPEQGAYTPAPAIALFAGQPAFLGWPEHEKLWRGQRPDVGQRDAEVRSFYAGDMPQSAAWLVENRIAYVLWLKSEDKLPRHTFERIDAQIRNEYFWREYYRAGDFRVGLWSRRRASIPPSADATSRSDAGSGTAVASTLTALSTSVAASALPIASLRPFDDRWSGLVPLASGENRTVASTNVSACCASRSAGSSSDVWNTLTRPGRNVKP